MENLPFSHDRISARLKQLAFLNKGLKITFIDENPKPKQGFKDASSEEFQNGQDGNNDESVLPNSDDNSNATGDAKIYLDRISQLNANEA